MVGVAAVMAVVVGSVVLVLMLAWRGRLTLVVVDNIAEVVAARVVRLSHAHAIVREVDIAIVAKDCGTRGRAKLARRRDWEE